MRNTKIVLFELMVCLLVIYGIFILNKKANEKNEMQNIQNEIITEVQEITEKDEHELENQETNIENEGFEEQGLIAYEGSEKTPNVELGEYTGLTYYSQIDNRWKNYLYTSIGNQTQTIGRSGCGPTAGAMIVSSIKGSINPKEMADLYVKYGYRSANQGTYWSAFKWTADVFNIGYSECYKLDDAIAKIKDNNYVIASCNQGLFTYGGHFVVLIGIDGDYIKIFDPYLYEGKFSTSSRIGKAKVSGNTVYVSIENFREYANYQKFFCFKNDRVTNNTDNSGNSNNTSNDGNSANYQVKITANGGLNIRTGASTSSNRIGGYNQNEIVTILEEKNGWGRTNRGWIYLTYTSKDIAGNNISNTVGNSVKLSRDCNLYSNSNLTGVRYQYRANTTVTILENVSRNVDKIRVNATGRVAYIDKANYKTGNSNDNRNNVGSVRKTKSCVLYSNSNLSGVRYQYKANTTVTILQHVNSYVDRVRVNVTGRVAYIDVRSYR